MVVVVVVPNDDDDDDFVRERPMPHLIGIGEIKNLLLVKFHPWPTGSWN